ncbi:MAG: peptidase S8, partial [Sphingomicrobium sp.]
MFSGLGGSDMMNKRLMLSSGATLATMLALSACGGGGGSDIAPLPIAPTAPAAAPLPPPPPPPATTTSYNTAEDLRSNAAVAEQAISAYQAGATGVGIKIGIVDSGINPALSEFTGKVDPASRDVAGS